MTKLEQLYYECGKLTRNTKPKPEELYKGEGIRSDLPGAQGLGIEGRKALNK